VQKSRVEKVPNGRQKEWVGQGSRPITDRLTGRKVGPAPVKVENSHPQVDPQSTEKFKLTGPIQVSTPPVLGADLGTKFPNQPLLFPVPIFARLKVPPAECAT
jgi:hypothetical protein